MSDLRIADFRERAERGIAAPDLATLERRGRVLRQRRVTAVAGGLALTLAVGFGATRVLAPEEGAAPGPSTPPSATPTSALATGNLARVDDGRDEVVLAVGPAFLAVGRATVRFDVPVDNWEWWGSGMGLRSSSDTPDSYSSAIFFLQSPSARVEPCRADRGRALGNDPERLIANVAPLLEVPRTTVLESPRVVSAFGGLAVHLRIRSDGSCREDGQAPAQFRGVTNGEYVEPGWSGTRVTDLWHVVIPGPQASSILVAAWDLGATSTELGHRQALLDSLVIEQD